MIETALPGGDVTEGVVRVGGTVRRPRRATSRAVAAYLLHLEGSGFDGAPRFLGTDAAGRDVLDHIPGHVAGQPLEPWVADRALLEPLGALLRRLHESSRGFRPAPELAFHRDLMPDPPHLLPFVNWPTIVVHKDVTPQNVVIRDGVPIASTWRSCTSVGPAGRGPGSHCADGRPALRDAGAGPADARPTDPLTR